MAVPRINLHRPLPGRPGRRGAFTILETAIMMVIIGLAVIAMLELLAAGTTSNVGGAELASAISLASNVREISLGLAFRDPDEDPTKPETWKWNNKEASVGLYDDIKDLDNEKFQPPLDVRREPITSYQGWAQVISVDTVGEDYLASTRPKDPLAPTARVTVRITHNGNEVLRTSWLVAQANPKVAP